ncbi:MAG: hypothetical protein M1383_00235 [Patescibacteria group bacterium]|nr:hypothetical protein [Patescibacteria group bacterium]
MGKKNIIIVAIIAVVFGGGGFFGGMQYQKSKAPAVGQGFGSLSAAQRQQFANRSGNGSRNFGNFTGGQIIAKDDKSITVKAQDGSTRIVLYTGSTQINKPVDVDASQLNTDDNVIVTGATNSDGSVTASNIQVRPAGQGFPGQSQPPSQQSQ